MEHLYYLHIYISRMLLLICMAYAMLSQACPTCHGRIEHNGPAFFSDEFDRASQAIHEQEQGINQEIEISSEEEEYE